MVTEGESGGPGQRLGRRRTHSGESDTSEVVSSNTSRETSAEPGSKRKRGRGRPGGARAQFRCVGHWREDHGQPLFGVSVNNHLAEAGDKSPVVFATVGFNRVTIYQCEDDDIKLLQCYADPDPEENFYTCAWSYDADTNKPLLAAAGARGIVRLFSPASMTCIRHFVGHGHAVNEVKFHPKDPNLLLSVSKDHAMRLWNIKTEHNIAILGGVEGHRDEVLSADFNSAGTRIISSGMDHSLKIWRFDTEELEEAIEASYSHDTVRTKEAFPTELCHFPDFSTRDIHRNYVDCCRWFGDFILSKSCENKIVCWKPGSLDKETEVVDRLSENKSVVIHQLDLRDCDIWFMRFSLDPSSRLLALGNQAGRIWVWDLETEEPRQIRGVQLSHAKCTSAVRQTSWSQDGRMLVGVCDDGTIWRWDRVSQ